MPISISVGRSVGRSLALPPDAPSLQGIPIGKLSLYIAAAGFHPQRALPLTLDMGCNTPAIVNDPVYLGTRRPRPSDEDFYEFVDEVMDALRERWPNILIQFEDFSAAHAFGTLERYRNTFRTFNDDIQGTGAVILSGFINAVKLSGVPVNQQRLLFYGAGSAGVGVAVQLRDHLMKAGGLSEEEANARFWLMDTKGGFRTEPRTGRRTERQRGTETSSFGC